VLDLTPPVITDGHGASQVVSNSVILGAPMLVSLSSSPASIRSAFPAISTCSADHPFDLGVPAPLIDSQSVAATATQWLALQRRRPYFRRAA